MTSANPSHTKFISDAQNANCFFFGGVGLFFVSKLFVVRLFFYCLLFFFCFYFALFCFFRCERRGLVSNLTALSETWCPSLSLSLSLLYSMVLTFSLLSIDECFDAINQCDSLANCHNTPGNHSYQCPDDYSSLWKDCIGEAGVYT